MTVRRTRRDGVSRAAKGRCVPERRAGRIGRSLHTLEELLLQLGLGDLDLDGLVYLLLVAALVIRVVLDGRGEEGVDKGGLSEAGLASNL
jgi:hypothetical protein